jgi:hypothetical protein
MYLPKSKYKVLKSQGDLRLPNGDKHTGNYIETYLGKYFTGSVLNSKSIPLTKVDLYSDDEPDPTPGLRFSNDIILPNDKDIARGKFKRFFVQDKRNKAIIEVKVRKYLQFQKVNYTNTVVIDWILKGPAEDITKSSYIQFGAKSVNKETVLKASKKIKELPQMINNYGQFVV